MSNKQKHEEEVAVQELKDLIWSLYDSMTVFIICFILFFSAGYFQQTGVFCPIDVLASEEKIQTIAHTNTLQSIWNELPF